MPMILTNSQAEGHSLSMCLCIFSYHALHSILPSKVGIRGGFNPLTSSFGSKGSNQLGRPLGDSACMNITRVGGNSKQMSLAK